MDKPESINIELFLRTFYKRTLTLMLTHLNLKFYTNIIDNKITGDDIYIYV